MNDPSKWDEIVFFLYGLSLIVFYWKTPIFIHTFVLGTAIASSHLYNLITDKGAILPREIIVAGATFGMVLGFARRDLYLLIPFTYSLVSKFI